jgi:hypothetical protein
MSIGEQQVGSAYPPLQDTAPAIGRAVAGWMQANALQAESRPRCPIRPSRSSYPYDYRVPWLTFR